MALANTCDKRILSLLSSQSTDDDDDDLDGCRR
eukprot:CAMPEP_0196248856 /NCGR_PEP_ID=MMETSP0913-20130531/41480_1 /TAXON_ID=49265 /ORGANISM="Thalassiosira rotula, Strain GSO102" /LENGTH=32 /DNA_ID= /DNA_START= /DNA_END= /DNA_ORIENTATION=